VYNDDDDDDENRGCIMMTMRKGCPRLYRGSQLLFKKGDGDDTRKDREKDTRIEIQLITTEAKGELNWIQNQNTSQGERKRTKEENAMNGRTKNKHERKDRARWENIH
jgi:hypothetical protein